MSKARNGKTAKRQASSPAGSIRAWGALVDKYGRPTWIVYARARRANDGATEEAAFAKSKIEPWLNNYTMNEGYHAYLDATV
jgi:hypothetical protein